MANFWEQWPHHFATVADGIELHYVDLGPRDATPLVLCHGWPDLWFGWRYQIQALSKRYRVIAPDLRGFGKSSAPKSLDGYGTKKVTNDLAKLLDILNIPKAVFIGHDWGGAIVWRMCMFHPARVLAVCGICTPYFPQGESCVSTEALTAAIPEFTYMQLLSKPDEAAKLLDAAPRRLFTATYRHPHEHPVNMVYLNVLRNLVTSDESLYTTPSALLTADEMEYYVREYSRTGFYGASAYYAMREQDFEDEKALPREIPHQAMYIGAASDPILKPQLAKGMSRVLPNFHEELVEGAGHWILWSHKEQVTTVIESWLDKLAVDGHLPAPTSSL